MKYLKYVNANGESIELSSWGQTPPYYVQSISGIGMPDSIITTKEIPLTDGSFITNSKIPQRNIVISATIIAENEESIFEARRQLLKVFRPKETGQLYYYINCDYGVSKEFYIDCQVEKSINASSNKQDFDQNFLISLLCPNPFWQTVQESKTNTIATYSSYFTFPFVSNITGGFTFATFDTQKVFVNNGDVPTPIKATFLGLATNPYITNLTTGETIKVNKVVANGEQLVITTANGNKKVIIIEVDGTTQNAFNYIDPTSVFFKFVSGENIIVYGSDDDVFGGVTIEFANSFLGV